MIINRLYLKLQKLQVLDVGSDSTEDEVKFNMLSKSACLYGHTGWKIESNRFHKWLCVENKVKI